MSGAPLISFYGDDFTGSTDAMEALSSNGIETVLFTRVPNAEEFAPFAHCRAVGLAGTSRSQSPIWMDRELRDALFWLKSLNAAHCHYKVCSTFDSAPHQGPIGRALEIGLDIFDQDMAAIIVGVPQLRRYTFFGHLFAGYRDAVYRIDRHPVMSRHPATPMREADLVLHLAGQTELPLARTGGTEATPASLAALRDEGIRGVLLDVHDLATQRAAGELILAGEGGLGPFIIGSSGVDYALIAAWRARGVLSPELPSFEPLQREARIAVVSGSCSPTTERQIRTAAHAGFLPIEVDYRAIASGMNADAVIDAALSRALPALEAGQSPILHTALGPDTTVSIDAAENDAVGRALGHMLDQIIARTGLARVAVAGGDTSSHALSQLGIFALTLRHPITQSPGSPVCLAHRYTGGTIEMTLKGGQIGNDDYLVRIRDGMVG
ncbi:four-carbon acid sugar kinase family protein [Georhizobium profundi]|uniref:Four-carbon acid sugar kinase family protein n=1 Tax=Georhizobium profundi TaxID=2341112 RepID=A0A3S9B3T7_9HYPH|nr:four-carbon acid sugar kinase family protein [Georhizobium profundi]AZN71574.1 four-carbon acid sugar kinase family protein [Georhizobium profundi]